MKNEEKFIRRERGADIVLELQSEALESSVAVSYLLRKALRAARKLKIIDQASWIQSELEGYLAINGNYYALPKYRFVKSKIDYEKSTSSGTEFHDPLLSGRSPSDPNENTEDYPCHVSIAEIERWLKGKTPDNYVHISCQPDVEKVFIETMKLSPSIVLTVQVSRLHGILDAVRKKIVDWTSELEENGIIVEDPPAKIGAGRMGKHRKAVTFKEAAVICGVNERTVKNWEAGKSTPKDWPGRADPVALHAFAVTRTSQAQTKKAIKNTARCGDMNSFAAPSKRR